MIDDTAALTVFGRARTREIFTGSDAEASHRALLVWASFALRFLFKHLLLMSFRMAACTAAQASKMILRLSWITLQIKMLRPLGQGYRVS